MGGRFGPKLDSSVGKPIHEVNVAGVLQNFCYAFILFILDVIDGSNHTGLVWVNRDSV